MTVVKLPGWASTLGKVSGYLIVLLVIYVMFLPFIASKSPYPSGTAAYVVTIAQQKHYLPRAEFVGLVAVSIATAASVVVYLTMYVSARFHQRGGVGG